MRETWLVLKREVTERLRAKSFRIVTALMAVAVAIGIALPAILSDDGPPDPVAVAVTPDLPDDVRAAVGNLRVQDADGDTVRVRLRTVDDADAGRRLVVDKDVEVLITPERLLIADSEDTGSAALVAATAQELLRLRNGLTDAGATDEQAATVLGAQPPPIDRVDTATSGTGYDSPQVGLVLLASIFLYLVIITYGQSVATGVNEEKSSRVVELLLAVVPARRLLAGKVVGIGLVGLLQVGLVVVTALVAAVIVGSDLPSGSTATIAAYFVWFLLAYALYCTLFAAAGALTSRQEDVQQATMPLMLVIGVSYGLVFVLMGDPDSLLVEVLSFVPFTAPLIMPARAALGDVAPVEIVIAMLLVVLTAVVALRIAARIYEGSILRFGPRVHLKAALRTSADV